MTVQDLLDWVAAHCPDPAATELRVDAFGGMRGGKPIRKASVGFDWDHGCVVLHPETTLTVYTTPPKKR